MRRRLSDLSLNLKARKRDCENPKSEQDFALLRELASHSPLGEAV